MSNYRDRDIEKIQLRQWTEIRREWRNYVPDHESPWPVPENEVSELPTFKLILDNLGGPEGRDSTIEEEIVGLRTSALQESVILIHKAGNVLRAAAEEGGHGYRTWSRSTAYHAAFFAMRGVLGLMGVTVFRSRTRNKDFQVDIWAPKDKKNKPLPTESRFAVRIICCRRNVQHKEMWHRFSRVLRVTEIDDTIWPLFERNPLKAMYPGDFSRVRHQIHYRSAGWRFNDLDSLAVKDDFSTLADHVAKLTHLNTPEVDDFPASLALYTMSMGVALIADLGKDIPKLKAEAERAMQWMSDSPWKTANALTLI